MTLTDYSHLDDQTTQTIYRFIISNIQEQTGQVKEEESNNNGGRERRDRERREEKGKVGIKRGTKEEKNKEGSMEYWKEKRK